MPIKNVLLPEYNFVFTYFTDSVDDLEVRAYSDQLTRQIADFDKHCEIIDFSRNVDFSGLSSETLTKTGAAEKRRSLAGTGPLAILVTDPLTFGLARAYSTFAAEARTDVLISYNLEECIDFMGFSAGQKLHVKNALALALPSTNGLSLQNSVRFNFPDDN